MLDKGIYQIILNKYPFILSHNLIEVYGFCLRNIIRTSPCPQKHFAISAFEISSNLICSYSNVSYLIDFFEIIYCISIEYEEVIPRLLTLPFLDILLTTLCSSNLSISEVSIKILGNITAEAHQYTTVLLDKDVLNKLHSLIYTSNLNFRLHILWIVSNIAAGTHEQIDRLIEESILVSCMRCISDECGNISRECSYIFSNLSARANDSQMLKLIKLGVVDYLKEGLKNEDPKTVLVRSNSEPARFLEKLVKLRGQL